MSQDNPLDGILNMTVRDWFFLVFLSVLWGGSFFFIELALQELTPLWIVALRVGIAALVLWCFVLISRTEIPRGAEVWLAFGIMGLVNNVIPFVLIVWGQSHIGSGLASILNATTPIFTVLVAGVVLHDERFTWLRMLGVVFGFFGIMVLVGVDVFRGVGQQVLAQLAILGAAMAYSVSAVYGRRFKRMGIPAMITATGQLSASALIMLVIVVLSEPLDALHGLTIRGMAAMMALAVFSTGLAYVVYFRILASSGATNVLLVTFLVPVTAISLGILVLGESLHGHQIAGMCLIALGLVAIDGRLIRRLIPSQAHMAQGGE